ncbi:MAG TPA: DUF402 domain-containing protein [Microlunatus sp.]
MRRWLEDREWQPGAYINLERPWHVGDDHYDTDDLTLDVVVSGTGEVSLKDEHELAWAEGLGIYSAETTQRIRRIGAAASTYFADAGWPLNADWDAWRPSPEIGLPSLPPSWESTGADSGSRS